MKNTFLKPFVLGLCLCGFTAFAQQNIYELPVAKPADAGMRSYHLSYIDSLANEAITEKQVPGILALVVRDGKVVYHKAFGQADPSGKKLETSSIFRIASQTKAITSTAAMILWERGKFQLDDPIAKYIPEFKDAQVLDSLFPDGSYTSHQADKPITIRHLLTHTSGIGYGAIDGDARFRKLFEDAGIIDGFTTKNITLAENEPKVAKMPLHHNPGERFTYSEGIDVVGYLVELLSGKKLDVFMREEIFEPLAMTDTYFYIPKEKHERLVAVQALENGKWTDAGSNAFYAANYPISGAQTFFSGGAGLSSTALDYAQFLQMYVNGGELNGKRILSPTTVDFILSNQIGNIWADQGAGHGLAFKVVGEGASAKGGQGSPDTFEWGGYFNTQYFADPQQKLIGIILKQTLGTNNDQTAWKFRNIVFSSVAE
ncbi:serine hydrolase domain-containing protein [Leeuwenhoekiella parthenopeia]|uniref:Beta-lactamase family protein n=1 Tax=Leeuwenhoekiella parthenopeia TaxID=2890320 RepID=A0ABS8GY44_9FLAO|nr:serine hydrolase domain-containing protein [Leeuwenhoekiella parthenopeia]MCC4214006.1 beta-lactamase family protein [Leeuwenhoekiella parthenopeia]